MTSLIRVLGYCVVTASVFLSGAGSVRYASAGQARAASASPPYIVEWVYRAKWGYKEEFLQIFKK